MVKEEKDIGYTLDIGNGRKDQDPVYEKGVDERKLDLRSGKWYIRIR